MTVKCTRIIGQVKRQYGYSERIDKIRIEEGPLAGIVLDGHIRHVKNKNVETDFTILPLFNEKGQLVKKIGKEGINVDFLIANQPKYTV